MCPSGLRSRGCFANTLVKIISSVPNGLQRQAVRLRFVGDTIGKIFDRLRRCLMTAFDGAPRPGLKCAGQSTEKLAVDCGPRHEGRKQTTRGKP